VCEFKLYVVPLWHEINVVKKIMFSRQIPNHLT
jgi:hypothetical protein